MSSIYRNNFIINQRGGSIDINNTTEKESIKLSHRSGSNISMDNVTNSELATNNKQTAVVNDQYQTVGNDSSEFVARDKINRVGGNTYQLEGFLGNENLNSIQQWKDAYEEIALINAQFKILRGLDGERADNPVVGSETFSVENDFTGYTGVPVRMANFDDVASYSTVPDKGRTIAAQSKQIEVEDVAKSAGEQGSKAPGVLKYGAEKSAATEGGNWSVNLDAQNLPQTILEKQQQLTPLEQQMGNGGDKIASVKRNSIEVVGAVFNDYPAIRIDEEGRSQPLEILVSDKGAYKNHDFLPHVEEVDNSSNFPGGEKTIIANNKLNIVAGSGGASIKTTGCMEVGGATLKAGFKKVYLSASHGLHLASEAGIELQSIKTICLRTNRQVYIEGAVGIKNNLIVRGGTYVEGETYLQHVTAPLEVQQTEDTIAFSKFACESDRTLVIGECQVGTVWYPVYAKATDNIIYAYPHSHHFNNIPLRLTKSNEDLRQLAQNEGINNHEGITQALAQNHEKKLATQA